MPFLTLSPIHFRNLSDSQIDVSANEVFFVGENGQGKSNLLEALYYASYASSFRTRSDAEIIRHGENGFSVKSFFRDQNARTHTTGIYFENGKKIIERNAKKITDRKELINTIPCVLFCHSDIDFASGEPERRRFFVDQSLTMYDEAYVDVQRRYKKVLKTRNLLLKEKKYDVLDALNMQLAENGLEIKKKREKVIFQFNQQFAQLYADVTGIKDVIITYTPSWKSDTVAEIVLTLEEKLDSDKIMCTTMSGPHRDAIRFMKDGKLFVPSASTGQIRLLSLLLRVSQAIYYKQKTGIKPIFLMDDVLLELDPKKREKITALLPEYDQMFCTFLPGEPYERYKKSTSVVYTVKGGVVNG